MVGRIDGLRAGVIGISDVLDAIRPRVGGVGRGRVILKPSVVRNVVVLLHTGIDRGGGARAPGRPVGIGQGQVETAHEAAPGDVRGVEKIADIVAGHRRRVTGAGAGVVPGIHVADHRVAADTVGNVEAGLAIGIKNNVHAVQLTGDGFQSAGSRRAVTVGAGVVAHGEVLGVVPHAGHGVAVEVTHYHAGRTEHARSAGRAYAGIERKQIGRAIVKGLLLGGCNCGSRPPWPPGWDRYGTDWPRRCRSGYSNNSDCW